MRIGAGLLVLITALPGTLAAQHPLAGALVPFQPPEIVDVVLDAEKRFQGDHVLFFYDGSEQSRAIVGLLYANREFAEFLTANFAVAAFDLREQDEAIVRDQYGCRNCSYPGLAISSRRLNNMVIHEGFPVKPAEVHRESLLRVLLTIRASETFQQFEASGVMLAKSAPTGKAEGVRVDSQKRGLPEDRWQLLSAWGLGVELDLPKIGLDVDEMWISDESTTGRLEITGKCLDVMTGYRSWTYDVTRAAMLTVDPFRLDETCEPSDLGVAVFALMLQDAVSFRVDGDELHIHSRHGDMTFVREAATRNL